MIHRRTSHAIKTLKQMTVDNPELGKLLETNRRKHATMIVHRLCGSMATPEQVKLLIDTMTMMNNSEFDDLNLIRKYLRGE